jgi:uncharacterized protein with GYD domain
MVMALYGIFGSHTTESCPLNNQTSRKMVIERGPHFKQLAEEVDIKVIGQYHSGLEHTFVWIVDAKDGHSVEKLMAQAGVHSFNALKIVPMTTFDGVIEKCNLIENT